MFYNIWDKVFKNGLSKICRRLLFRNLNGYGLLPVFRLNTELYFLKTVFHKFYLVHSWILCSIYSAKMKIVAIEHLNSLILHVVLCVREERCSKKIWKYSLYETQWFYDHEIFIILKPRLNCFRSTLKCHKKSKFSENFYLNCFSDVCDMAMNQPKLCYQVAP